jgi:hypothetical protein
MKYHTILALGLAMRKVHALMPIIIWILPMIEVGEAVLQALFMEDD